jgi:hypothetical protein
MCKEEKKILAENNFGAPKIVFFTQAIKKKILMKLCE